MNIYLAKTSVLLNVIKIYNNWMKKIFILCFLAIIPGLFAQNSVIDSLQQRDSQTIANEKILALNGHEEFQAKYQTEKKDQKIKRLEATIKNKNLFLGYSLAGISSVFIVLIFIAILYKKKNEAYRRLVYQSINVREKNKYENDEGDPIESDEINSNNNHSIDDELKQQILITLEHQMESKVYREPSLTLKQLAGKCGTNRSYLSQIIHEKYEMNFNNFINNYRIDEAKLLIMQPSNNIPLKALHEKLGFSSYIRFHEAFKKCTGVTPSFFQKTIKNL